MSVFLSASYISAFLFVPTNDRLAAMIVGNLSYGSTMSR
jgi:hypothetical protein